MSDNKKVLNVPNLRFKMYNDIWSTNKLIEVVSIHARIGWQGLRQSEFLCSGDVYLITGTDFEDGKINLESCKYIGIDRYNQDKNIQISNDDILITKDGSIGKIAYIDNLDKQATLNAGVYRVRTKNNCVIPKYLFHYLNGNRLIDYANKQMTGGTIKHLNQSAIINMPVFYPTLSEQKNIISILDLINKRIETQIKIIEHYESLIKGIKELEFNNHNKKTSYRLIDVLFEKKEYAQKETGFIHATLSKEGVYPKTERYNRDFLVKDEEKEYKITKLNDICFNPANLKFGVICKNNFGNAIFSPIYVTYEIKEGFDIDYVAQYLCRNNFINWIRKYEQGTVYERMAVSSDDFLKGIIYLPIIEKQQIFSNKINKLSRKIKIEKRYLLVLSTQKKYLLDNLFI